MAIIGISGTNYEVHEEVAEHFAKYMRKSKAIESAREDAYMKRSYMLTEFGLDGSTCKQIKSWLDEVLAT